MYGQLGRAKIDLGVFPVEMSFSPVFIAAGLGHSLAICQFGESDVSVGDNLPKKIGTEQDL